LNQKVILAMNWLILLPLLAGALFLPLVLGMVATLVGTSGDPDAAVATTILGFTGAAVSVFFVVLAAPFLATGWGMLKLKPWARIAGIVLGALSLANFPLGTAIGVYALLILFKKETEALFAAPA
jgi:hypothetical protein